MTAPVSPVISTKPPIEEIKICVWSHLNNVHLTDPDYRTSGKIDLLIGADIIFMDSIKGRKSLTRFQPFFTTKY